MALQITSQDFNEKVLESKIPVLVDFWAQWCAPCRALAPTLDELYQELEGKVVVAKINVDEDKEFSKDMGIKSIPTLILFANGEKVDQTMGLQSKEQLLEFISKHVKI